MEMTPTVNHGRAAPTVTGDDLATWHRNRGSDFELIAPAIQAKDVVLTGRFQLTRLKSGLTLHATDATDMHDLHTQVLHEAGITIGVFLQGRADISIGDRRLDIGASGQQAFMLSYAESDRFIRRGIKGNRARKVCINIPPEWIEGDAADDAEMAALYRILRDHARHTLWTPSLRHIQLAEQILIPSPYHPLQHRLHLESAAIEIVAEVAGMLGHIPAAQANSRDIERIEAACAFIEAGGEQRPHLDDVAQHVGMSVSALQRLFRRAHRTSIFEHVRSRQLDRARMLLERGELSVIEASDLAGYSSAANFATAFRRRFGLCPSKVRGRTAVLNAYGN